MDLPDSIEKAVLECINQPAPQWEYRTTIYLTPAQMREMGIIPVPLGEDDPE